MRFAPDSTILKLQFILDSAVKWHGKVARYVLASDRKQQDSNKSRPVYVRTLSVPTGWQHFRDRTRLFFPQHAEAVPGITFVRASEHTSHLVWRHRSQFATSTMMRWHLSWSIMLVAWSLPNLPCIRPSFTVVFIRLVSAYLLHPISWRCSSIGPRQNAALLGDAKKLYIVKRPVRE